MPFRPCRKRTGQSVTHENPGHLAAVTELGFGVSVATSIKDIWNALRARWHGDLTLLEHYPAAGSFPGDGDDLYQAIIGLAGAGHDAWPGRRRQLAVRVTAVRWALLAPVAAAALTVYARSPLHPHP